MTTEEMTIALLDIKAQIEACQDIYIIRNTLRYKAMQLAARFADPTWAAEQEERAAPVLRSGIMMSMERDIIDGVLSPF